ncbi:MAG: hypothetical protein K1060chlam5_00915 [Candidatus Anoxychlamydiales bacterium]|nr:hypothetical protein [Candidatus Anoxychlamydiales bacterium]
MQINFSYRSFFKPLSIIPFFIIPIISSQNITKASANIKNNNSDKTNNYLLIAFEITAIFLGCLSIIAIAVVVRKKYIKKMRVDVIPTDSERSDEISSHFPSEDCKDGNDKITNDELSQQMRGGKSASYPQMKEEQRVIEEDLPTEFLGREEIFRDLQRAFGIGYKKDTRGLEQTSSSPAILEHQKEGQQQDPSLKSFFD